MDEDIDGASFAVFDDFGGIKFLLLQILVRHQSQFTSRTSTRERSWYTGLGPQFGYLTPTRAKSPVLTWSGLMPTALSCT